MHHAKPHEQLFNTQCQGLSEAWARAVVQEARDSRASPLPRRAGARLTRRAALRVGCSAGALVVACSAGVLALWLWVLPAQSAGSALSSWAGDSVPVVDEAAS